MGIYKDAYIESVDGQAHMSGVKIIEEAESEISSFRAENKALKKELEYLQRKIKRLESDNDDWREELARFRKKYEKFINSYEKLFQEGLKLQNMVDKAIRALVILRDISIDSECSDIAKDAISKLEEKP